MNSGCQKSAETPMPSKKIYQVRYLPVVSIKIDGMLDDELWSKANCQEDFVFPWRDRDVPQTKFYALCDDTNFYFAYDVIDHDIVLKEPYHDKNDVAEEDRVELFFAADLSLKAYWGLEIDPLGRLLDYQVEYHRQFDFDWFCPGITTAGTINNSGYTVEGMIPLETFRKLGLPEFKPGNKLHFGLYRGEFSHLMNEDQSEKESIEQAWISWVDPKVTEPDFHIPSSFGIFEIVQ